MRCKRQSIRSMPSTTGTRPRRRAHDRRRQRNGAPLPCAGLSLDGAPADLVRQDAEALTDAPTTARGRLRPPFFVSVTEHLDAIRVLRALFAVGAFARGDWRLVHGL